ncbi:hypothetical protein [Flavivirga algicola]|uniref:Peptidase S9 prolyl oligopeptidase catalytic domain-containing protein n=1 Tax=Flavivirga algicola TaxID=2729136 RepID=A0ABX1S0M4_9FLAO|nr:hypothetical protein [Flavivirga algicola]NMH89381.1 hypothetical protein [Flavivirga algicola]
MIKHKVLILLIVVLPLFGSCNYISKSETNFIANKEGNNDIFLENWKITGPFYADSLFQAKDLINYPVLQHYNAINASRVTPKILNSVEKNNYSDTLFYVNEFTNSKYSQSQGYINFKNYFDIEKTSVIYLSCNIFSDKEKDVCILFGSDDSCIISLNGKVIHEFADTRNYSGPKTRVFGHLKKGNNFLLIKLGNVCIKPTKVGKQQEWRFSCNLASLDRYYSFYLKNQTNYFKSCVLPKFFPLELKDIFHKSRLINKVNIYDINEKLVYTKEDKQGVSEIKLPNDFKIGLYEADLISDSNLFHQSFFYGDIDNELSKKVSAAQKIIDTCQSFKLKNTLKALIKRDSLINDHFYKRNGIILEQFSKANTADTIFNFLNFPSRWVNLKAPKKIKFSLSQKQNRPISEIRFYKQDNTHSEIRPVRVSDSAVSKIMSDGNLKEFWRPSLENTPVFFEFDKERPNYMAISTNQSNWSVNFEKSKILLYRELYDLTKLKKPFRSEEIIINSFVSKVDSVPQYYTFHKPIEEKKPIKKPLVVVMPVTEANHLNYLKSTRVANNTNIEFYKILAERYNCYVAAPGLRTHTNSLISPIAESDFFSLIEEVSKNHPIDTSRIYLYSKCGATGLSLCLTERYPDKIAALSIGGGTVSTPTNSYSQTDGPYAIMENLKNNPIYAFHNEYNFHTDIKYMAHFIDEANQLEAGVQFEKLAKTFNKGNPELFYHNKMFDFFNGKAQKAKKEVDFSTYRHRYNKAYWLQLFPMKSGEKANVKASVTGNKINVVVKNAKKLIIHPNQVPIESKNDLLIHINNENYTYSYPYDKAITFNFNKNSKEVGLSKNEFTEGPLVDVFGGHFIVVKGSLGSRLDKVYNDSIANSFIDSWHKAYYAYPPVKYDKDVDKADLVHSNLIIIGNQHTNLWFKKIYKELPLKINTNGLKLDSQSYKGNKLGYCIVYPNPLNPDKYIVLLGGNNNHCVYKRKGNMAVDGYYDYEVEDVAYNNRVLGQGYFNESWKIAN